MRVTSRRHFKVNDRSLRNRRWRRCRMADRKVCVLWHVLRSQLNQPIDDGFHARVIGNIGVDRLPLGINRELPRAGVISKPMNVDRLRVGVGLARRDVRVDGLGQDAWHRPARARADDAGAAAAPGVRRHRVARAAGC